MTTILAILLIIGSVSPEPVALLARIGKTISYVQIDPVTLHLSESRIVYKPIGEELQVSLATDLKSQSGFLTIGQSVHRVSLNGSTDSSVFTVGGVLDDTPTAIAYDWLSNKIYVAISTIGPDNSARIQVCEDAGGAARDGECAVILHDRLDYLHSLVLDPVDGNMYWINAGQNQIERAFMNGQHHDLHPFTNPASSEGATLTSLALSREASSLFYVRTTKDQSELWQCRLYERQSCSLFFTTTHILHLAVHEKFLLMSLNSGRLAICEYPNCEGTFHEVEQIGELEVFEVIHKKRTELVENACSISNGGCSHLCLIARIAPKRTCACPIGIKLKKDGKTCEEKFNEVLLISAITGLFFISLDTTDYTPQAIPYEGYEESSHSLFDVDYDPVDGFVYWLDITDTAIKRCRFNGSELSVVVKEGISQSTKTIRLDIIGRNIYWVDGETALIWICKMDGSIAPRVLDVTTKLDNPHGLAVDANEGVMYLTDWREHSSRIIKMNLDGREAHIFYQLQNFSYPTGIDLDTEGGRLYWAESNHSLIKSIKLDASDLLSYMQSSYKLVQPYSVSKLGNRIYCNSMAGRSFVEIILRVGILAGHDSSRVVESQIYGPVGMRAVQLNGTIKKEGVCAKDNGGCDHYCLNSKNEDRTRCLCARGFELQSDGRKCVRPEEFVLILDGSLRKMDMTRMSIRGRRNNERLHVQGLSGIPHSIAYNQDASTIFIASTNDSVGTIERLNFSSPTPQTTVIKSGIALRGISHLAVHSNLIIYSNSEMGRIEAMSIDGRHQKTLAWTDLRPSFITLDPIKNEIYYVNESTEITTINRMAIDVVPSGGSAVYRTTNQIGTLTYDAKSAQLYWTEQNRGVNTLHQMVITASGSTVLSRSEDRRISHLQFYDGALYYIDSKKNEFGYLNGSGFHSVHAGVRSVRDFLIIHPGDKNTANGVCDSTTCPELCLSQSSTGKCVCGDHRNYDIVSKTCSMNAHGIIMASNSRFLLITAKDSKSMLNGDHSPITTLPVDRVGLPLSIAVDDLSRFSTLYWIDANEPKLVKSVSTRLNSMSSPQSLAVTACAHLRSLAVDTYGRQLFLSCVASSGRSHIMVFRIQSSTSLVPDKLLHIGRVVNGDEISPLTGKRPVPTEMAVGARKLVFLDVSTRSGRPVLVVCDLDGRNCRKASERTQGYSRLSILPNENRVLYTGDDSIYSVDLTSLISTPIEIDLRESDPKALFTPISGNDLAMIPIDEKEDSLLLLGSDRLSLPGLLRVSSITSFTASQFNSLDRSRSCAHQECTHMCSASLDGYECLCPLGYTLSLESSYICMQNVSCEPWEWLCRDQRTCVHAGSKCDSRLNCPDGSDESPEICSAVDSTSWMCADGRMKIDRYLVCDGTTHCEDGSDEIGCRCALPSSEMDCALFGRMPDSECVQRRLRCDHHYDCGNGADEDERLCSTFSPETAGFRLTFTHIMYGAIAFLVLLAVCPISLFFCYNKKRTDVIEVQTIPDRRYHLAPQDDPSLRLPLATAPPEHYEMRAYSLVESTSTYPSLPPPIPSLTNSSAHGAAVLVDPYYGRTSREHPSRFYAPPPSAASLSTYGIVVPSFNSESLSQRRIVITEQAVASPSSRSGVSPPPAYLMRSTRDLHPSSLTKQVSSSPSTNRKQGKMQSRATLNRSHSTEEESDHGSVSLSSHSSEGAPTSSRNQL